MKKLFIISSILLAVVLIFLGIYNFAFRKNVPTVAQTAVQAVVDNTKEKIPINNSEKIVAISNGPVLGVSIDKKTEEIKYYDALTGLTWKTDSLGKNKQQISNTKIAGLKSVLWSPDHSKVLTSLVKDGQNLFYEYDYQSQKATNLKIGLDTAVWDNLGTKIFYKYFDSQTKKRTLNIANPDGSGWQKVADIEARNISISPVPLSSQVSFWNSSNALEQTQLQIASAIGGDAKIIFSGKYGADYLWAPNGSVAIVSALSNKDSNTMTLGTVSIDGKYQDLNIPTLVSKCAWSEDSKTLYYALPGGIPADSVMPNDYQENKFTTDDTFWKMDLASGEKSRVIATSEITGKFDSTGMILSSTEDALYFINKIDKKLYRLEL